MFQDLNINNLVDLRNNNELILIDVRSPSEFRDATIPGSINIPLFNDEERAEIGTIYKQNSIQLAKERGLEIVSAKLPTFIKEFTNLDGKKAVFCWRGGMRSKTAATVLDLMGIKIYRLHGGVRAYRSWVIDELKNLEFNSQAYILNGFTGAGKTKILRCLQDEGQPVLDLEGMANHRGSIFGQIGLEPNNQKMFESHLVERLLSFKQLPYVVFEAESKRVGKVVVPQFLIEAKEKGIQLFIDIPLEERVQNILEDYCPWEYKNECIDAFQLIKNRIHTPIATQIENDLHSGEYESAVRLLLEYYYDPRYSHMTLKYLDNGNKIIINARNTDEAVEKVKQIISNNLKVF